MSWHLALLSCPGWSVLADLSWLICLGWPVQTDISDRPVKTYLSRLSYPVSWPMSFPRCHDQTYCHGYPATIVPFQLSSPSVMFWSSCPLYFACLYHPDCLLWLSCPSCPTQASYPSDPAPAFLSPSLLPRCLIFVIMFSLSSPICFTLHTLSSMSCPGNPILTVLSWLSNTVPTWLIKNWRITALNKWYKEILFPESGR